MQVSSQTAALCNVKIHLCACMTTIVWAKEQYAVADAGFWKGGFHFDGGVRKILATPT